MGYCKPADPEQLFTLVKANTHGNEINLNTDESGYENVHSILRTNDPKVLAALKGKKLKITGH
jgi:hypothetical protein